MCQQRPGPHCAHQVKGAQPCSPFSHTAGCLGLWQFPPAPRLGTLVSSGRSPAAFIFICFLRENSAGSFARLTPALAWDP